MTDAYSGLHPILRDRWSPLCFDVGHELDDEGEELLLEAARWAPSAGNSQPWSFVLGRRGTPQHALLVSHLAPSTARWAPDASVLVVNLVHRTVAGTDLVYSEFAEYDVGQAVAHMTIQAHAMGLACRQFRAFDLDGLTAAIGLEEGWAVLTMTAVGRSTRPTPEERERRSLHELTRHGLAGRVTH